MSGINVNNNKIQRLLDLQPTKPVKINQQKITLSSLRMDTQVKDKVDNSTYKTGHPLISLNFTDKNISLPEVKIKNDGDFTFSRNAFNRNISTHRDKDGSVTSTSSSKDGLTILLVNNPDKRDVIVFSNMNSKIAKNSSIPNVYFHVDGKEQSKMYFDDKHNLVIDLKNKEKIVIDGKDGQTILSGPFKLNFNPDDTGKNFKVNYSGSDKLKKFSSLGDHIQW